MIPILEVLPTVYLTLYVLLACALLVRGFLGGLSLHRAARITGMIVLGLFVASLGTHLFHFVTRWVINGHAPLQSKHEVFTATGLTTMIFAVTLWASERQWRTTGAAALFGSFVFVLMTGFGGIFWTALGMKEAYKVNNLVPALQSAWHPPHVSAYMLGYGSLGLAAILAFFYLAIAGVDRVAQRGGGKSELGRTWLPMLDRWTYKIVGRGFPFMTAALCMGALWADSSWGEYWFWDAKETWALISWAFFLIYFHLRFVRGWAGFKGQVVVLLGGIMIWITYMAIHILPASQASLHVYN